EAAAVKLDELAGERESEPGAFGLSALDSLFELFEDPIDVLGGDARARVRDDYLHEAVVDSGRDVDEAVRRGELDGIRDEVEDNLPEATLVGGDQDLLGVGRERELDIGAAGPLCVDRD